MIQKFLLNSNILPEAASLDLSVKYEYEKPLNFVRGMDSTLHVQTSYNHNVKIDVSGSGFYSSYFADLRPGDIVTVAPHAPMKCKGSTNKTWVGVRTVSYLTGSGLSTGTFIKMEVRNNTTMFQYEWDFYYPTGKPALQHEYYVFYPSVTCVVTANNAGMDRSSNSFSTSFLTQDSAQVAFIP
jgi:hypothetical protein